MAIDRDEQIRRRAHQIWESEGRPHGQDEEHWQKARAEIEGAVGVSGTEADQRASLRSPSSSTAQDSAASRGKRAASPSRPTSEDGTSTRTKRASRSKPAETAASSEQNGTPAKAATKKQGNMPSELGGRRGEHSGASSSVTYRHPENPDLTWSGRGRRPAWIREAVEAGRSMSDFEIGA